MDPQEIVVKPLARVLRHSGVFSGASVLGNGQLALILDLAGLAAKARIDIHDNALVQGEKLTVLETVAQPRQDGSMLIFEDGAGERAAIALCAVERIERVAASRIEFCGGRALMQYGGAF